MRFSTEQLYRALDSYKSKGCPYCDGSGVHTRGDLEICKDSITIEYICPNSGRRWTEVVDLHEFLK